MKKLFILLLLGFILLNCSKKTKQEILITIPSTCSMGDVGYNQLNEGEMHNQLVNLMIKNWNICSDDFNDLSDEIKRILRDEGQSIIEGNNMTFDEFKSILNSINLASVLESTNVGFEQQINTLVLSSELNLTLRGFIDIMEDVDYTQGVISAQSVICDFYEQNQANLNQDDLIYFGAMVDVANSSIELWLGSDLGGENKYNELQGRLYDLCGNILEPRCFWCDIFLADAVGIFSGATSSVFSSGGASALPNPLLGGLPTASIIGLIGGATASIGKAI